MFGAKTTELLRRLRRFQYAQKRVVAIKSAKDTRYSEEAVICTHAKDQFTDVLVASELSDIDVTTYDVIGVDEGQFYSDLDLVCEQWAERGKVVIVAMLDGTYARQPFPSGCLGRLLPRCESVEKLSAVCRCGADAAFSELTSDEQVGASGELVGGAERYRAACRACHGK
jgi:thymidine kinase